MTQRENNKSTRNRLAAIIRRFDVKARNVDADELADMNVWLAQCDVREEENVAVDAAKPRHLVAVVGPVLASFRQNLLYWDEKVVTHHT